MANPTISSTSKTPISITYKIIDSDGDDLRYKVEYLDSTNNLIQTLSPLSDWISSVKRKVVIT